MPSFDIAVYGAGLAGLSIAHHFVKADKKVLVIDPNGVAGGASGAPAGLVNPAAARRAKITWNAEACYSALKENLDLISEVSDSRELYNREGILRPAITEELAENFKNALIDYDWPKGWVSWLDEVEVNAVNPDVADNYGGLFVHCGLTVYMDKYLKAYHDYLQEKGVVFWEEQVHHKTIDHHFQFVNRHLKSATTNTIVFATGANTVDFSVWEDLQLHNVKGELVEFETDAELAWDHSIAALGYVSRIGEDGLVAGSTYDHYFHDLSSTDKGLKTITQKLGNMLPELAANVKPKKKWADIRVSTPNRLPIIGPHKNIDGLYLYTGLGSKGLLYSEYVGGILARHILDGEEIPEELHTSKIYNRLYGE